MIEPEPDLREKIWAVIGVLVIFGSGTALGILIGWGLNR